MLRTFLKKNKKGFTLTELMIVVVISASHRSRFRFNSSVTTKAAVSRMLKH